MGDDELNKNGTLLQFVGNELRYPGVLLLSATCYVTPFWRLIRSSSTLAGSSLGSRGTSLPSNARSLGLGQPSRDDAHDLHDILGVRIVLRVNQRLGDVGAAGADLGQPVAERPDRGANLVGRDHVSCRSMSTRARSSGFMGQECVVVGPAQRRSSARCGPRRAGVNFPGRTMELLIIRHAIAEDGAETTRSDDERRLTTEGRKKMRLGARGLTRVVPDLAVLASSPLVRARQTADIVARAYGGLDVTTAAELAPDGSPNAVAAWLNRRRADGVVALVGHEPALSNLVSWLLSGAARPLIEMKKGAACLLAFPGGKAGPGTAVLRWALTPAQLRDLGA